MPNPATSRRARTGRRTAWIAAGALIAILGGATTGLAHADTFSDDDGNVHEASIDALAAAGITRGCNPPDNDRYCPEQGVTRGEMAAFLVRALELPASGADAFSDDDGSVFEGDVDALAAAGITRGCNPPDNDRYCPEAPVRRDEMASFLFRALDLEVVGTVVYPWSDDGRIQQWRPLVERYFPPADVEMALGLIRCESVGNPEAVNPPDDPVVAGLLQHKIVYWPSRYETAAAWWQERGIAIPGGGDIFDPETNIAVGGWLFERDGIDAWDGCKPWVIQFFE